MGARFEPPVLQDNPSGWGPNTIPVQFKDMPYQPFSKSDRLGKVSDWTGATYQDRRHMNKYQSQFQGGQQYSYYHDEDESSFQLVDTARVTKPIYGRGRGRGAFRGRWNTFKPVQTTQLQTLTKAQKIKERDRQRQVRKWQKQQAGRQNYQRQAPLKSREASVTVKSDWIVIEEMDFPRLGKLALPSINEPSDLLQAGCLEYYDKTYDRVNVKTEKPLQRIDRIFHTVTTTDDPVIRKLVKSDQLKANVFITDAILATLMCATRSAYSWDIVVHKIGDKIFFDKRENTEFDLLTVSETSAEPPQDEGSSFNSPRNLALEATFVNHNFSQQVLKTGEEKYKLEEDNPFVEPDDEGEVASVGYRYRKWELGNNLVLVCRCEVDAVQLGSNNEVQFLNIKALNEWDSRYSGGVDWRQKLDTQRGAVLANELKNNACKLAKWTVQAILAGVENIKFGYVTRFNVKDNGKHVILGTQQFKPVEFAQQINLSMDNAWGVVRCILDLIMQQKDGKYLIVKDPNKQLLRLYDIPDNTFDSEDSQESSDEDPDNIDTPLRA